MSEINPLFDISGSTAVVTGASGVLGESCCRALIQAGVKIACMGRDQKRIHTLSESLGRGGSESMSIVADCLDRPSLEAARDAVKARWGRIDFLLNFAGGNRPDATTSVDRKFFDLPQEALAGAVNLNLLGTILPCQVFGQQMAAQGKGVILNISSMAASRPLTRVVGYSAAKAAVDNFTQWLAVHLAKEYSPNIRCNALAPGFFLTEQNRFLLTDKESGQPTERGKSILAHTPMARFGNPDDLTGGILWLLSPAAKFVTGIVLPIDGGFNAFSGV
ncbi:MAG TPA: SDR family oxidoreductase [Planctomycetota bacterium]|nr:SDR family oxidoreductase [Planctomycetota bacterium]